MYRVVTENPQTLAIENEGEFSTFNEAQKFARKFTYTRVVWIINLNTGEII